jgi:hypothetical protein
MKRIREIISEMVEGATDPVLCRADDDGEYVVKHRGCGRDALIREWIAGRIGRRLDLPIPEFDLMTLDPSRARYIAFPRADDLAACPSFGSRFVASSSSLLPSAASDVPPRLRAEILLFDWWVLNGTGVMGIRTCCGWPTNHRSGSLTTISPSTPRKTPHPFSTTMSFGVAMAHGIWTFRA